MDGLIDYHINWGKSEKDKSIYHLYVESLRMMEMNLFTKQTHRHKKQTVIKMNGRSSREIN